MANNPETVQWEAGIIQTETTDLVQGGLGGPENAPHVLLGNRTAWLKSLIDSVATQVGITPDVAQLQLIQSAVLHVGTIAALRAVPIPSIPNTKTVVIYTRGGAVDGDGAGGLYRWVYNANAADDGELVIQPGSNPASGRWQKITTGTSLQAVAIASGLNHNFAINATTGFLDLTPTGGDSIVTGFTPGYDGQTITGTNTAASLRLTIARLNAGSAANARVRAPDDFDLLNLDSFTMRYSKSLGLWVRT